MSEKTSNSRACSLKPVLDIYLTIEACANIIFNLHISRLWLYFRMFISFYVTLTLGYSLYYWHYDGKILKYFMTFVTNWVLAIQWIYFLFATFLTYKIYQQIEPKFEKTISNRVKHAVSQDWDVGVVLSNLSKQQDTHSKVGSNSSPRNAIDITEADLRAQGSYDMIGKPPNLSKLGYKGLFLFAKSLLELSLPYSFGISCIYWLSLFGGSFEDIFQAIYYTNAHGVVFVLQLIDCFFSTYQLRFAIGSLLIIIMACIAVGWMWLFEEINLVNPFTNKSQLYSMFNWHDDTTQSVIIYCIAIVSILIVYWFIVFTKNIALIHWKMRRQYGNKQLSADDNIYSSDDDDDAPDQDIPDDDIPFSDV